MGLAALATVAGNGEEEEMGVGICFWFVFCRRMEQSGRAAVLRKRKRC